MSLAPTLGLNPTAGSHSQSTGPSSQEIPGKYQASWRGDLLTTAPEGTVVAMKPPQPIHHSAALPLLPQPVGLCGAECGGVSLPQVPDTQS